MTADSQTSTVFISYAHPDTEVAERLSSALNNAGFTSWLDQKITPRTDWQASILRRLRNSDVIVVLLSRASATSDWVAGEAQIVSERSKAQQTPVVTAVVDDVEVPGWLRHAPEIDLRLQSDNQIDELVAAVGRLGSLRFAELDYQRFEALIGELLSRLGFNHVATSETGADFQVTYDSPDPFGGTRHETWLVEVKHQSGRVSVAKVAQFAGLLLSHPTDRKGALITSTSVTSAVREYIKDLEWRRDLTLRIIDGAELRDILTQFPDLVDRYF